MTLVDERATATRQRRAELADGIKGLLPLDYDRIVGDHTCLYIVGSGGRGEMSSYSDADLFVARVENAPSEVDAFQVREAVARALFKLGFDAPSQGGDYLKMHTASGLCDQLGKPADDSGNTFTARMLLLLESQPLLGEVAYDKLLQRVVDEYWKDGERHSHDFQPIVLVNDVVRFWRSLLLNYVAKNVEKERESRPPEQVRAERALRSYKLRFSRCVPSFSLLATLLEATRAGAVTREQVLDAVRRSPMERLRALTRTEPIRQKVSGLVTRYETFLMNSEGKTDALLAKFSNAEFRTQRFQDGEHFGEEMFELLMLLGGEGRARTLFRYMVV